MIAGHFATALIPASRNARAPLWLWFLAAMLPDYIYFLLAFWGIERPLPSEYWTTALRDMKSVMPYSHSVVAIFGLTAAMGLIGRLVSRDARVALWCGGLVVLHFFCDLLSGFQHEIAGAGSFELGFNFYNHSPLAATLIEVTVSAVCVGWYIRQRIASRRPLKLSMSVLLLAVFLGGSFLLLPIGNRPLIQLFSPR